MRGLHLCSVIHSNSSLASNTLPYFYRDITMLFDFGGYENTFQRRNVNDRRFEEIYCDYTDMSVLVSIES